MKALPVVSVYALSILASVGVLGAIAPVQAAEVNQSAKFVCGTSQGYPATVALTPRGSVPVVRWSSNYFGSSGFSPQQRCKIVSAKFQQYYQNGTLNYLTTGWANRQPVVCVAAHKGGPCSDVLFTLKPGSDPYTTLTRLMQVRVRASGPLNESASSAPVEPSIADGRYVDMNAFLDAAPVETVTSPGSPTSMKGSTSVGLW